MGIDLDALAEEAERDDENCVVTRRWLKQVLRELMQARSLPAFNDPPALDYAPARPTR